VAFERDSENRRRDLARMQNKRIQEFDLLTTTAGLDLIHIVQATEPSSPVEPAVGSPPDLRRPASGVFSTESPAAKLASEARSSSSHRFSADASALVKTASFKDQHQRSATTSTTRVVPQYVPAGPPKPKPSLFELPSMENPSTEKSSPSRTSPENTRL